MTEENRPATTPDVIATFHASESLIIERIDKFETNILTAFREMARSFEESTRGVYKRPSSTDPSVPRSATDGEV